MSLSSARREALKHLNAATETGVKGDLLAAINAAVALADPQKAKRTGTEVSPKTYEHLPVGERLRCPANPGLLMRHAKKAGRVWFFIYRDDAGKEKEHRIGTFEDVSVSEARQMVRDLRQRRANGQPLVDSAPDAPLTMDDLCERFIKDYALGARPNGQPIKRSGYEDERLLRRHIIPAFGSLPATQFDGEEHLRPLLSTLAQTAPREAEKLRAVLSTLFNVASGRTRKIAFPDGVWLSAKHPNPTDGVLPPAHKPTSFCPNEAELRAFLAQLGGGGRYDDVLKLQVLVMGRVREAGHAEWTEFDLDEAIWTLPATRAKNGCEHRQTLPVQAVELLRAIKAQQAKDGIETAFVFPSPKDPSRPINAVTPTRAAASAREAAGLPDGFGTHALRHAGLTWLKEQGCSLDVRNAITNHKTTSADGKVDAGYTGTANLDGEKRRWLQRWADHLFTETGENVVPLRAAS